MLADLGIGFLLAAALGLTLRARRRAARVEALRRTLNDAIVHDLKNPLASVMGNLSCSLEDGVAPADRERLARKALLGCRTLLTLLETLLDTSRLEAQELAPRRIAVPLRPLLQACVEDSRGTAQHLGITLREWCPINLPETIAADPELLPRVLANLLQNAIKYTPAGGEVFLGVTSEHGVLRFEVRDTGIGIAPEHIAQIFGKYYRVEDLDQSDRRGAGLGLYFCRLVVESHGGRIAVASGVGKGTSITFTIPA